MFRSLWLRPFLHRWFGHRWWRASANRPAVSLRRTVRPHLEWLEDRLTPSTAANTAALATVIQQDNTSNTADTIVLTGGVNDYQLTGQLKITDKAGLTIQGQGQTIDAGHHNRAFLIDAGSANIVFQDLTIRNGVATDDGTGGSNTDALGGGILDKGSSVTLSHVMLNSNAADANGGHTAYGGGIYALGGSLTLNSSVLQFNGAFGGLGSSSADGGSAFGGGVYASGTTTTIAGSRLSDNVLLGGSASGDHDGGVAFGGGVYATGATTTITNSDLSGNQLTGGDGRIGGYVYGGSAYVLDKTVITASNLSDNELTGGKGNLNSALSLGGDVGGQVVGGGVYAGGTTIISSSNLSGNTLKGGEGSLNNSSASIAGDVGGDAVGGGVYFYYKSTSTIKTSILSGNTLTGGKGTYSSGTVKGSIGGSASGGGVYGSSEGIATALRATTLSGNTLTGGDASGSGATPGVTRGGGAYFAGAGIQLVNATIANNQASSGNGGGLYFASTAAATLANDTVAGNAATLRIGTSSGVGGGIDNDGGTVQLINTLVAHNSAGTYIPDYNGPVSNSSHNLIGNANGSSGFNTTNDQLGTLAKPIDPHLGQLANNGGPLAGASGNQQVVQTMALLPGSPAINAGDNTAQSATGPYDQRGQGFVRVANGSIDIGAFEVQPSPPSGSPPSPKPPPTLHTPPLLAFFDSLLGGVETINGNGTETVVDRLFGMPLFISTYDGAGDLIRVTLFGIDVTLLMELL